MYPVLNSSDLHAMRFAKVLGEEIEKMRNNSEETQLKEQMRVYNQRWTWDYRINQWNELLNELSAAILASKSE
jgi:phage terminase small subunit